VPEPLRYSRADGRSIPSQDIRLMNTERHIVRLLEFMYNHTVGCIRESRSKERVVRRQERRVRTTRVTLTCPICGATMMRALENEAMGATNDGAPAVPWAMTSTGMRRGE
jgi:hypothetical protein